MLGRSQLSDRDVQCDRSNGESYVLFGVVPSFTVVSAMLLINQSSDQYNSVVTSLASYLADHKGRRNDWTHTRRGRRVRTFPIWLVSMTITLLCINDSQETRIYFSFSDIDRKQPFY